MKKVSVVMCTYNGEKYLKEQLDSILGQTYPIEEILIQDDCSSDSTIDIIKRYQETYPIIKLHINQSNMGVNHNFFSVMNKAVGDYIAISDQDDVWELNKIEKQINTIGDKLLCFSRSRLFNSEDGSIIKEEQKAPKHSLVRFVFLNMISGHLMLIDSKILKLMPFRDDLRLYDYYLGLTAATYNSIAFCNEVLCNHRIHTSNVTFNDKNINIKKTPFRPINVIISSFAIRRRLSKRVKKYFDTMQEFIAQTNVNSEETKEAKKIASLMVDTSLFSTLKAMKFCIANRDKILNEDANPFVLLFKSAFFPFQCYHLFDY